MSNPAAYLDYQASTPMDRRVVEVMLEAFVAPGNASSDEHAFGWNAGRRLAVARELVASAIGGIPEVVRSNETGILVEFDNDAEVFEKRLSDSLSIVLGDESLAKKLGTAGRKRAIDEFGWDKVANQTINLYRSLI